MKPTITIESDLDTGTYTLMATSRSVTAHAGPRLFRAPPWPAIQFQHTDRAAAEKDAAALREYLAGLSEPKKGKSRARGAYAD